MSVVADFPVIQRPWQGYIDPGLPVGMWIAQGTILGDASAGTQAVIFTFKGEGQPLGGRFYDVEQLEVHSTDPAGMPGEFSIQNMDVIGSTGLVTRRIHFDLASDGFTNTAMQTNAIRLPLFLGRPQLIGIAAEIAFSTPNQDLETFFATAQGYIWEPRSLLTDGGLRRPIDSLYG